MGCHKKMSKINHAKSYSLYFSSINAIAGVIHGRVNSLILHNPLKGALTNCSISQILFQEV